MGLFDRVEGKLERAYNGIFARAFRAEVQPVEIASAIRRAMDDRASHAGRGRAIVPNVFTIELSDTDHDRLTDDPGLGRYRVGWVGVDASTRISRDDLADFIVTQLDDQRFIRRMPFVSH